MKDDLFFIHHSSLRHSALYFISPRAVISRAALASVVTSTGARKASVLMRQVPVLSVRQ
jgi:hypothetical protein